MEAYNHQHTALAVTDYEARILFCNQEFKDLLGLQNHDVVNQLLKPVLERWSTKFADNRLYNDLLSHENSFTTLRIQLPTGVVNKWTISHSSFTAGDDKVNRIFTFTLTAPPPQSDRASTDYTKIERHRGANSTITETTQSLIETNVDLRRENRKHLRALRALKESELRFRNLTETTSDFIWELDREGKYTYASPKSLKILGFTPEELINTTSPLFLNHENMEKIIDNAITAEPSTRGFRGWKYTLYNKDGRKVIMESSGEPIYQDDKQLVGFRGIDRDITERVEYVEKLKQAKLEAELANEAKSEFLANMSHELRTPIHAILSYSHHGEKKVASADRKELRHFFRQISRSINRLFPLIDSLLDLSKLEAGKVRYILHQEDIRNEVLPIISELKHLAEDKNITFNLKHAKHVPLVSYDRQHIGQVIRNLLANAIRFGDVGSVITVSFTQTVDSRNCQVLRTTISNKGVSIPPAELESIFQKFVQSSKTRTGAGGTGLGLSICKKIIDDHKGEIWAENGKDDLTHFHFTLPIVLRNEKIGQILLKKGLITQKDLDTALRQQQMKTC